MLHTPRSRRSVVWYAVAYLLAAPLVTASYYIREYDRGAYPPEADDILIPIYQFSVGVVVMAPAVLAFVWLCVRRYPGRVSLLAWSAERPFWSLLCTAVFGSLVVLHLVHTPWHVFRLHPAEIVQSLVLAHLLLVLRAATVMARTSAARS